MVKFNRTWLIWQTAVQISDVYRDGDVWRDGQLRPFL